MEQKESRQQKANLQMVQKMTGTWARGMCQGYGKKVSVASKTCISCCRNWESVQ